MSELLNRETKAPGTGSAAGDSEQAKAAKIQNRASELRNATPSRSWQSCWDQAVAES